jgi:adenosine/AMP kinase
VQTIVGNAKVFSDTIQNYSANAYRRVDLAAGHVFVVVLRDGYPINVLGRIKDVPEVCSIFCATANPVQAVVAQSDQGRGVIGVIDGFPPKGVETAEDVEKRRGLLRAIGYKR